MRRGPPRQVFMRANHAFFQNPVPKSTIISILCCSLQILADLPRSNGSAAERQPRSGRDAKRSRQNDPSPTWWAVDLTRISLFRLRPGCGSAGSNEAMRESRWTPVMGPWISLAMSSALHPPPIIRRVRACWPISERSGCRHLSLRQSGPCIAAKFRLRGSGAQVAWEFHHAKTRTAPALSLFRARQR